MAPISSKQRNFLVKLSQQHPRAFQAAGGSIPSDVSAASKMIDSALRYIGGYRPGTLRATVAESLRAKGMSAAQCFCDLHPILGTPKLRFMQNSGSGYRTPLPMSKQADALRSTIHEVRIALQGGEPWSVPPGETPAEGVEADGSQPNAAGPQPDGGAENSGDGNGDSGDGENAEGESGGEDADGEDGEPQDGEPQDGEGEGESEQPMTDEEKREAQAVEFLTWIQENVRPFCESQNADGAAFDTPGMRAAENGAKMIACGIPIVACKSAMTLHYPAEARRHLGVKDFDTTKYLPKLRREGMHKALPYCLTVINAGVPLALIGKHGTGKTTLAKQIAQVLDLPFGGTSMTSGTSPSAFNGRVNPFSDEKTLSQFLRVFCSESGRGGVYLFDEMDAADENLFLKVNMALANGVFFNDATGEEHKAHSNFIPIAGMNTMGLGADRDYVGRVKLDAAALDRWAMGRVKLDLDPDLERHVFLRNLRETEARFDLTA